MASSPGEPFFQTRGVVLVPEDLTLADWPERAKKAGLTTLGLHGFSAEQMARYVETEQGQRVLERCCELELEVEYELHALSGLLPRALFKQDRTLFRMNEQGERTPDANLCPSSVKALEIVAANAVPWSLRIRPTTGRYFYWGDDAQPWCHCPKCAGLSASDQALVVENNVVDALRKHVDPSAMLAHLAYSKTLLPPKEIKPKSGIFLEFAPIKRRYDIPFDTRAERGQQSLLDALDANLAAFGAKHAQALEYWLDVSMFSNWRRDRKVKLPWNPESFAADLDTYGKRGVRHITSFAVYIDADYVRQFGEPPVDEYGARLADWRPRR